eukprot:NODE_597_length_5571_cov_0.535270.p4 type:complete len:155 gc:universal NODE_597_length_5571_cov_0.535270:4845-4381(-)
MTDQKYSTIQIVSTLITILLIHAAFTHNYIVLIIGAALVVLFLTIKFKFNMRKHQQEIERIRRVRQTYMQEMENADSAMDQQSVKSIFTIDESYITIPSELECCICCEEMKSSEIIIKTDCNHEFHKSCLKSWHSHKYGFDLTCPLCRDPLFSK